MKAKPTKGPHSCPAGPTATLADSVQLPIQRQGKYYASLAEPDPEKREQWGPPCSRELSYSPRPGNRGSRLLADWMGNTPRSSEKVYPITGFSHLSTCQGAPQS